MRLHMRIAAESNRLYPEYRAKTEAEDLPRALRMAAVVLFVINTSFIGVDWVLYPHQLLSFLPTRLGMDFIVALVYFATTNRFPVASSYATVAAGGWMLFTVVHGTGGASSDYYVGLVLLIIGLGVLAPLSPKQGMTMIGGLFAGYLLLSLWDFEGKWNSFAVSVFFLGAASFCGTMSCIYLDRMRFADFLQRREIEKARDELKDLDTAKSRFTANIHHELRTPLTLTLAPVEAMLGGDFGELTPLQRGYLETVQSNGLRLLKLINNLLDLAKIESQQLKVQRRPVRVAQLCEGIVAGARPLAERKGVSLEVEALDELPEIHVDPEAFEKILVNLLGNALKFTERGGAIRVQGVREGRDGVHLVVADTGAGIPPNQLERIFDRFAQVDGSNTRKYEGTGIGLALVKELVELHGGRVWAESHGLGHGAQMHVVLPRGESDAAPDAVAEALENADEVRPALRNAMAAMGAEIQQEEGADAPQGDRLKYAELERNVERAEGETTRRGARPALPEHPPETPEVLLVEDNV